MISIIKKVLLVLTIGFLASCSQVLETVTLELNDKDPLEQEKFTVIEKTLTMSEAQAGNLLPFARLVSQSGIGKDAKIIAEIQATKSNFPAYKQAPNYKVGVGDTLEFIKLFENLGHSDGQPKPWYDKTQNEPYRLGIGDQITLTQLNEDMVMLHCPLDCK